MCHLKFIYKFIEMKRRHADTWPVFRCPNYSQTPGVADCSGEIVDYESSIETKDAEDRIKKLLYANYTSPLVVTATLIGKAGSSI